MSTGSLVGINPNYCTLRSLFTGSFPDCPDSRDRPHSLSCWHAVAAFRKPGEPRAAPNSYGKIKEIFVFCNLFLFFRCSLVCAN